MKKTVLITGSNGLIGSEASKFFIMKGYFVVGIDNDMRSYFFGEGGSTESIGKQIYENNKSFFILYKIDIRDENGIKKILSKYKPCLIIHTAAQPSHDWAAKEPLTDFSINAFATLILLENYRKICPEATFIFTSTNKVYGDHPNDLPLVEKQTRFEIADTHDFFANGINESFSIDQTTHSLFGASKLAADVLVQEYGRYFNLNTAVFRGGCLTGPAHRGVESHGFLSYLVQRIWLQKPYTIYGYSGKQVRDNIHSIDFIHALWEFYLAPKSGAVYNIGGGRERSISILEAIDKIENVLNKKAIINYSSEARKGDHIWYISDVRKFRNDYPKWKYLYSIDQIISELCLSFFSK